MGSQQVLDVQTLTVYRVQPWVPHQPGVPINTLARAGDEVRAFSPGRSAYVLAGWQTDYARGRGDVHGLLVVDIAKGTARELRVERRRMPWADSRDMDRRWIETYFEWQRDAEGDEHLVPRAGVVPQPWRGRLFEAKPGELTYRVPRVREAFADELRRIVLSLPGAALVPDPIDPKRGIDGFTLQVQACLLGLHVRSPGMPDGDEDGQVSVFPLGHQAVVRARPGICNDVIRRSAAATDDELASGRHDRLVTLD